VSAARASVLAHVALAVLAIGATLLPADPVAAFGWWRDALAAQPWRLVSGHLAHLGPLHLALNLASLFALALVHRALVAPAGYAWAGLAALLAVDAMLHWGPGALQWYAGLSGILHGLAAWLALELMQRRIGPRPLAWMLFAGLTFKVAWEATLAVGSPGAFGIPRAPTAHLAGFMGGCAVWLVARFYALLRRSR